MSQENREKPEVYIQISQTNEDLNQCLQSSIDKFNIKMCDFNSRNRMYNNNNKQ